MAKRNAVSPVIADVCLYGSPNCGIGYLTSKADGGGLLGDGEPRKHWSMTDALWMAAIELRDAGYKGTVRVFAPGGQRMATMDINQVRYAGELDWTTAPVYEVSYEAIMAAAE